MAATLRNEPKGPRSALAIEQKGLHRPLALDFLRPAGLEAVSIASDHSDLGGGEPPSLPRTSVKGLPPAPANSPPGDFWSHFKTLCDKDDKSIPKGDREMRELFRDLPQALTSFCEDLESVTPDILHNGEHTLNEL